MLSRRFLAGLAVLAALAAPSWARSGGGHGNGSHGGGGSASSSGSSASSSGAKSVYAQGYTRKNVTHVRGYYRAAPGEGQNTAGSNLSDGNVEIVQRPAALITGGYATARLADGTTIAMRGVPLVRGRSFAFTDDKGRFVSLPLREVAWTDSGTHHRCTTCSRDAEGHIVRSEAARREFERMRPCPATAVSGGSCPGYIIDHVTPLACGGEDAPTNMQWQTLADAKAKDEWERKACGH